MVLRANTTLLSDEPYPMIEVVLNSRCPSLSQPHAFNTRTAHVAALTRSHTCRYALTTDEGTVVAMDATWTRAQPSDLRDKQQTFRTPRHGPATSRP